MAEAIRPNLRAKSIMAGTLGLMSGALVGITLTLSCSVVAADVPTATQVAHPISFSDETLTRQKLVQAALGREPADLIIRGATVLNVFTLSWEPNQDIVVCGKRIAWVGALLAHCWISPTGSDLPQGF
jgi:adenine deaminase